MKQARLHSQRVEFIPEQLSNGVLYVSERYNTATHNCCCGCGLEVVTPLTPNDWKLQLEGDLPTLKPSIGNWSFPCRSHYWITRGRVSWAADMPHWQVAQIRALDRQRKDIFYAQPLGLIAKIWAALKRWW